MANPRADFSAIVDRPLLHLPGSAKVAVLLVVNVEQKEFDQPVGSPLSAQPNVRLPEVPAFSLFEYGLRVGIWRILEATRALKITPSMTLNASVYEAYARVADATVAAGWDVVAHGYHQRQLPAEENERNTIRRTLDTIEEHTGKRPLGWLGPGLAETFDTPDILAEEGVRYVLDWVNDDQPYPLKVKTGSLLSVPYSNELNDIGVYIRGGHKAPELHDRVISAAETLLHDVPETARILPIAVHPFIMGQAHRFPYFVRMLEHLRAQPQFVFMTATEIYEWYTEQAATAS